MDQLPAMAWYESARATGSGGIVLVSRRIYANRCITTAAHAQEGLPRSAAPGACHPGLPPGARYASIGIGLADQETDTRAVLVHRGGERVQLLGDEGDAAAWLAATMPSIGPMMAW